MTGTVSSGKEWFCTWHHVVMHDPEWAEDYQQFMGWREKIRAEYPGTDWLPDDVVWQAITGRTERVRIAG
ncbi:MAG: hypothetical protein IT393_07205 [Nitrospirae bacterium]|nr:hypothetical protein [Nitrospirota bacterium]